MPRPRKSHEHLDKNGKLLQAQKTGELEQGQSYNLGRMTAFFEKWAPPAK